MSSISVFKSELAMGKKAVSNIEKESIKRQKNMWEIDFMFRGQVYYSVSEELCVTHLEFI